MKKGLLLILALTVLVSVVFADYMQPGPQRKMTGVQVPERLMQLARPDTCTYTFTVPPVNLLFSYYDYMIGGYNDLPLCVEPVPAYGGYFLTFHGRRQATSQRRVFYSYINDFGIVENMNEITNIQNWEGYPSMDIDPVSGKPMYAWHVNADADAEYEVQFAYDAFIGGAAGIFSDPQIIIDNPSTVLPYGSTTNEFIWPTLKIGPSPIAGKRRAFILARNAESNTSNPSENVKIAYADFNGDDLETAVTLTWSYTSIPTLDAWNHDQVTWRRPMCAFTIGNDGTLYYVGYHVGVTIADDADIYEPDLDAFICGNYGEGTWQRVQGISRFNTWNPPTNFGNGPGAFTVGDVPVPDDSVFWEIYNSSHTNAVIDNQMGRIHLPAIWANLYRGMENNEIAAYWHPTMQTMKDLVFDANTQVFSVRELYPVAGNSVDNVIWQPWDTDGDGLVDEFYDNPQSPDHGVPLSVSLWPFPYWDDTVHTNAMYFHYNNQKMSNPNEQGMMAAVWQDSNRARLYNKYPADYPEYAAFGDTPEIFISCSPDRGITWSEPFSLNKAEVPQMANMRPMWVYPADKVKYIGVTPEGKKKGKLALMFYDDLSWGAYAIEGPVGQNSGGYIRFTELEIVFPYSDNATDPVIPPAITMLKQNYPNPFRAETSISFNMPKGGHANLSIYNTKGQLVKTLFNGKVAAGDYRHEWNGKDEVGKNVASGLYFYKLNANGKVETRKMMVLK